MKINSPEGFHEELVEASTWIINRLLLPFLNPEEDDEEQRRRRREAKSFGFNDINRSGRCYVTLLLSRKCPVNAFAVPNSSGGIPMGFMLCRNNSLNASVCNTQFLVVRVTVARQQ